MLGKNTERAKEILENELHFQQPYPTPEIIRKNQQIFYENPNIPGLKFSLDGTVSRFKIISDKPFDELKGIQKQVFERLEQIM